jgi:hypothetical protein
LWYDAATSPYIPNLSGDYLDVHGRDLGKLMRTDVYIIKS